MGMFGMNMLDLPAEGATTGLGLGFDDGKAVQKVSYTHDKLIDLVVANPRVRQGALAAYFGYTEGWVSRVMSSDAFKLRMAQRRMALVDPLITATLEERFSALALRGLEVMQEKLDQPADLVPFRDAAAAVELGGKGLAIGGFGARVQVDVHNSIDLRGAIEEGHARRMEHLQRTINQPTDAGAQLEPVSSLAFTCLLYTSPSPRD